MIDVKEHYYDDDPNIGHPDVRTVLENVSYFFLGNGLIQAAIQFAPAGQGTPLGVLIMDPETLGKKREALTMDSGRGLEPTAVELEVDGTIFRPRAGRLRVGWMENDAIPSVRAEWAEAGFDVVETFRCPDLRRPVLTRAVSIRNSRPAAAAVAARTSGPGPAVVRTFRLAPGENAHFVLGYVLDAARREAAVSIFAPAPDDGPAAAFWGGLARASFGHPLLDRFFNASRRQLPAVVSRSGRMDGSVWQYNREWLRDQAIIASALAATGADAIARTMFERLCDRFVTPEGDTVDSSERRDPDEVELDQNGFLLVGLRRYASWTGDFDIVRRFWPKIQAAAEFPLRDVFRHRPSGLLMNRREFWERHRIHGIETGLELMHQVFTVLGLESAAVLARTVNETTAAERWDSESARIRHALLEDRIFRLADNRGFIKRRGPDGRVQETITPWAEAGLPSDVPLRSEPVHALNPDSAAALPIALGLITPESPLAGLTLSSLEGLWNQAWTGGGYGRYHFSSEPDSAGPWPIASLFMARAGIETGRYDNVRRILEWMNGVSGAPAGSWFEFYGPRKAPPFPQNGILPWTWAEIIVLAVDHILGVRPDVGGLTIRPRLWPGLGPIHAELNVRGARLRLDIEPRSGGTPYRIETNGRILRRRANEIILAPPDADIDVRFFA